MSESTTIKVKTEDICPGYSDRALAILRGSPGRRVALGIVEDKAVAIIKQPSKVEECQLEKQS